MFINHNRCPDCGARLKHYYHYCGKCNNTDINDWRKTWLLIGIAIVIAIVVAIYLKGLLCGVDQFHHLMSRFKVSC